MCILNCFYMYFIHINVSGLLFNKIDWLIKSFSNIVKQKSESISPAESNPKPSRVRLNRPGAARVHGQRRGRTTRRVRFEDVTGIKCPHGGRRDRSHTASAGAAAAAAAAIGRLLRWMSASSVTATNRPFPACCRPVVAAAVRRFRLSPAEIESGQLIHSFSCCSVRRRYSRQKTSISF